MDRYFCLRCRSFALRRLKQSSIKLEAGNTLRRWRYRQREAFVVDKNTRGINDGVRVKRALAEQAIQKRQRFRRDELATNFVSGEAVFFQQKHAGARAYRGDGARRAGRTRPGNNQIVSGFQTITPMRKR